MKKEYINPEMEVIKMQTMTVLAMSKTEEETDTYDAPVFQGGGDSEDW